MAIDTNKPAEQQENPLRTAMNRAGDLAGRVMVKAREEPPLELTDVVGEERRPLRRVDVKLGVLSYINAQFRQRTSSDGTILEPSLERLIEDLTELVMELDQRAAEPAPPIKKPIHHHA